MAEVRKNYGMGNETLCFKNITMFFVFFLCLSCSLLNNEIPFYERKASLLIDKVGNKLASKYNMKLIGTGGGMIDCIKLMSLAFNINKPLNKNESRKIVLDCTAEFLREINSDQEIRSYLVKFPFPVENVEIGIYIYDENGRKLFDPNISVVSIDKGNISYLTNDKENKYRFKSEFVESYKEALKLANQHSDKME